jgi:hypothetical protein
MSRSGERAERSPGLDPCARRHLRLGWWLLLAFLTLGIVLESLLGFKVPWFVNVASETRRTMWRLAHAHGTLLALVHIAFGLTLQVAPMAREGLRRAASRALVAASFCLPGGFFLGGCIVHGGDPGLGVLLVPAGAVLLFAGTFATAAGLGSLRGPDRASGGEPAKERGSPPPPVRSR